MMFRLLIVFKFICLAVVYFSSAPALANHVECQSTASETSPGWGWENNHSCRITSNSSSDPICIDYEPLGDGWGWNGSSACEISGTSTDDGPDATDGPECVDSAPIGDGWGWDGSASCRITTDTVSDDSSAANGVTDVILMAGQSNAAGEKSLGDGELIDSNIVVWIPNKTGNGSTGSWQVADLCSQEWYDNDYHSNTSRYPMQGTANGNPCQNHPALQIAKSIRAADSSRKVGIIVTALPGTSIDAWTDYAQDGEEDQDDWDRGYAEILNVASGAIANLPSSVGNNRYVKYIAWAQGEDDRSTSSYNYNNSWGRYYFQRFTNLVTNFQAQSWFRRPGSSVTGVVVPQYLAKKDAYCPYSAAQDDVNSVNRAFDEVRSDLPNLVPRIVSTKDACAPTDGTHYDTATLRRLGGRHASVFLSRYPNPY